MRAAKGIVKLPGVGLASIELATTEEVFAYHGIVVAGADNGLTPRERLCAAASELFYAEGIHTVGIDRLIERAGVAKATLYSSFGGKDQLVKAYLEQRHEMLVGWLSTATE